MFDSGLNQEKQSRRMTRRVFLGAGGAALAGFTFLSMRRVPAVEASGAGKGTPGMVTIVNFSDDGKNLGKESVPKVVKTDAEWKQQLSGNAFNITRRADTEIAYTGSTWNEHGKGIFRCICCDTALFDSKTKFDSGTGWPSFWAPIAKENILEQVDGSFGMTRTEVKCRRCEAHLGHVFDDGPPPTGLRYCMNSASMRFVKA
ncbi:Peptide methionine sulfoxide reductase MsrB [Acidisarcina polymorpha]|uniref:peptide-methionine (R)-S-oxide reductase n=1 Tax=Acidisarcina polymorpha TaxID=2211140 RepID=A0A2Z5FUL7_9BACT|nr:peptide-methionine (R)-S-oxide reductase MsrB [Acidisarcina polymorpha]AXC10440.1 Peptide methionine sulfoxide reductase MsrB [Acidisarcina polymorpha]